MRFHFLLGSFLALGFADISTAQDKSWIAYCEGVVDGRTVAYVSDNTWRHHDDPRYREKVSEYAMQALTTDNGPPLFGCSGVPFSTDSLAEFGQQRVVAAHSLNDTPVEFFQLPVEMAEDLREQVQAIADLERTRASRSDVATLDRFPPCRD